MNKSSGNRFTRNIVYYTDPNAFLLLSINSADKTVRCDHNLFWRADAKPVTVLVEGGSPRPLSVWQARGQDTHSIVADPRFVDPARDKYALRPESPAWELGFKPIDTSRIGLLPRTR